MMSKQTFSCVVFLVVAVHLLMMIMKHATCVPTVVTLKFSNTLALTSYTCKDYSFWQKGGISFVFGPFVGNVNVYM